jgi:hypothetical protein
MNQIKVELITEGTESYYRLSGPFTQSNVKNRNGRIYPYAESKREILKLKERVESGEEVYLYMNHPPHSEVIREDSCAVFESITFEDNGNMITGYCTVKTLPDTITGKQINESLSKGESWGISTRGTGQVVEGIVQNYNMITADLVQMPSCQICNMSLTESAEESNTLDDFILEAEADCGCFYSALSEDEQKVGQRYLVKEILKLLD